MYLRSDDLNGYETNNYCNIVNVTKAILGVTSKIEYYNKIECVNQKKEDICTSMKDLFENSYVLPTPHYINVVNILENSVMTTLNCNKIKINKFNQNIPYSNYEIILFLIISFVIYFFVKKYRKNK